MGQRLVRSVLSIGLIVASGFGCTPGPPPAAQSEPPPFFRISRVSNGTPEIGDSVEVEWEYGQDVDADYEPTVTGQIATLQSLTIDGGIFRETFGCYPVELPDFVSPDDECLDLDKRKLDFVFRGPVMLIFRAWDDEPTEDSPFWAVERVVKFTLPGMSFTAEINNVQTDRFIDNGTFSRSSGELLFDRVFGIYEVAGDDGEEDGVVDDLGPASEFNSLFPSIVETLSGDTTNPAFFARSTSSQESDDFELQRGSNFPVLPPEFYESEGGDSLVGMKTSADIVIFAGTIAFDGESETLKTDEGTVEIFSPSVNYYVPIFIQLDLRSVAISPARFLLSDVHSGNLKQGLVMSAYLNHDTPVAERIGSFSTSIDTSGETFVGGGSLKDALIGFDVITEQGDGYTPAQARVSAEWEAIPIYPDNDISGLEETFVEFSTG